MMVLLMMFGVVLARFKRHAVQMKRFSKNLYQKYTTPTLSPLHVSSLEPISKHGDQEHSQVRNLKEKDVYMYTFIN
jgi:hypothetical protein